MSEGTSTQTSAHLGGGHRTAGGLFIYFLLASTTTLAQTLVGSQGNKSFKMDVSVDEVGIIFHASDAYGKPIGDLSPSELDLFDNETGPGTIVALQKLEERPLRIGFIVDTSGSVSASLVRNRAIALAAAQRLMQKEADFGLAIGFRRSREIVQPWSNDLNSVSAGIRRIGATAASSIDGTSIFDSLFSTCFYEFGTKGDDLQNLILLFSDGEDNASQTTLQEAVETCQHTHTAIYAFTLSPVPGETSTGPATLRKLTEQTGGRVIRCDVPEAEINDALDKLASDLRDEYQLFYRPKSLKHDGSFHQIVLVGPPRVASIVSQSGYYAPAR